MVSEQGWVLQVTVTTLTAKTVHVMDIVPEKWAVKTAGQAAMKMLEELRGGLDRRQSVMLRKPAIMYPPDRILLLEFDFMKAGATPDDLETFMEHVLKPPPD